ALYAACRRWCRSAARLPARDTPRPGAAAASPVPSGDSGRTAVPSASVALLATNVVIKATKYKFNYDVICPGPFGSAFQHRDHARLEQLAKPLVEGHQMQVVVLRGSGDPGVGNGVAGQAQPGAQRGEMGPLLAERQHAHAGRAQHGVQKLLCRGQ